MFVFAQHELRFECGDNEDFGYSRCSGTGDDEKDCLEYVRQLQPEQCIMYDCVF